MSDGVGPGPVTLHAMFAAQAAASPDAVAVTGIGPPLTYRRLAERAWQLARLLRGLGVGPETPVAVSAGRGPDLLVAILGILASGGAWVPLDPEAPDERLRFMLSDSKARILVTGSGGKPISTAALTLSLPDAAALLEAQEAAPLDSASGSSHLAYVLYTSGSTGVPRAVMVEHGGAVNLVRAFIDAFHITPASRVLQFAPAVFDAWVEETFTALGAGATLVLAPDSVRLPGPELVRFLETNAVSVATLPPAVLAALPDAPLPELATLVSAGDSCTDRILDRFAAGRRFVNAYGPTEITVCATLGVLRSGDDPNDIGLPLPGVTVHVLDEHLSPVPHGQPGELYVGGVGVARGYLGAPDLSAARFIPDPFGTTPGARLHRTGDRVRVGEGGRLHFLGRTDGRVKVRGCRVELGEIESASRQHPAVGDCAAVHVRRPDGDGDITLFYAPRPAATSSLLESGPSLAMPVTDVEVRRHLQQLLPAYAVPSRILPLPALPLTRSGKVDRPALVARAATSSPAASLAATSTSAERVAEWRALFDEMAQSHAPDATDPRLDTQGWTSSRGGLPFAASEMREWVEDKVEAIRALGPRRVLELGCGTGMLLLRIAPHCEVYDGTDFSRVFAARLASRIAALPEASRATVTVREADDFRGVRPGQYDTVVINSVAQHFPDDDYLLRVIGASVEALAPGGFIFLGDVRSLPLLEAFHTWVQLEQADDGLPVSALRSRVDARIRSEEELVLDPSFFHSLPRRFPTITSVGVRLQRGRHHNEMTAFRYNVCLRVGPPPPPPLPSRISPAAPPADLAELRGRLREERPETLLLRGLLNARVKEAVACAALLSATDAPATVAELRARAASLPPGFDPEDLRELAVAEGYHVEAGWSGTLDQFDVLFHRGPAVAPWWELPGTVAAAPVEGRPMWNVPLRRDLPPAPSSGFNEGTAADRDGVARRVAAVWAEVLGRDDFSHRDNFFDAGGHSLALVKVRRGLHEAFGVDLTIAELFRYTTVEALAARLAGGREASGAALAASTGTAPEGGAHPAGAVAVVGLSGRFPGAPDLARFWDNLCNGVDSIVQLTDEQLGAWVPREVLADPDYVKAAALLSDANGLDADFFAISSTEAERMDPQHRLFLEQCHAALEHAGYDSRRTSQRVGVFGGAHMNRFSVANLHASWPTHDTGLDIMMALGNDKDFLATRVAYKLDLRGPALDVQTACSTSLVAVHAACQSLQAGQCDMALAGGVSVIAPQAVGYRYREGSIFSRDGRCRPFDRDASGTVVGSGVGVVVLKRLVDALRDGDTVHAVILGAAVNNDGARKASFTAPGVEGQEEVIRSALRTAGIAPQSIGFVEAHGTGTRLGDPIEIEALARAYGKAPGHRCAVGSVKSNVGHLAAASGIAGMIKAILALKHRRIPPTAHFRAPNEHIDFAATPFFVNTEVLDWEKGDAPRRAAVSSFGFGGTNAHVILEEAPPVAPVESSERPVRLLCLSARSEGALRAAAASLASHLRERPDLPLADVAYTLHVGRGEHPHRAFAVCRDVPSAVASLDSLSPAPPVPVGEPPRRMALLFPGQGVPHPDMGRALYQTEPVFRAEIDRAAEILLPLLGLDLRAAIHPSASEPPALVEGALAQPALFAVEYALARLLESVGPRPAAAMGHSLGEYAAAAVAGVFTLEDALALLVARGQLMQAMPPGRMVAVLAPLSALEPWLGERLSIAGILPDRTLVSGPPEEVEALEGRLATAGIATERLPVERAFHSWMMEPLLADFEARVRAVHLSPPSIPFVSNVTGDWITAAEATDPTYWVRHARQPVQLARGLDTLAADASLVFVEAGPGRGLSRAMQRRLSGAPARCFPVLPSRDAGSAFLSTLGGLWSAGVPIDWQALYRGESRRRVPLPTYPFERRSFPLVLPERTVAPVPSRTDQPPEAPASGDGAFVLAQESGQIARRGARIQEQLAIPGLDAYPGLREGLSALTTSYISECLSARGVGLRRGESRSRDEWLRAVGVLPRFHRFFDFLLDSLERDGHLARRGEVIECLTDASDIPPSAAREAELAAAHPGFAGILSFLRRSAEHLGPALCGEHDAVSVLFPDGTDAFIRDCEQRTVEYNQSRVCISLTTEVLAELAARPRARPLRILEVGGGRGLLTWPALEALRGARVDYHFTDIGRLFVLRAEAEAARRGITNLRCSRYDIAADPVEQGLRLGDYDVILALNVVHATPDVRRTMEQLLPLLAPAGLLMLIEAVEVERFHHLMWGLAPGYWDFNDGRTELLMSAAQWEAVLARLDVASARTFPAGSPGADHRLFIAQRPLEPLGLPDSPQRAPGAAVGEPMRPPPAVSAPVPDAGGARGVEARLVAIWEAALGVRGLDRRKTFFDAGGDSLVAVHLLARVRDELGVAISMPEFMRDPTVAGMGRLLESPRRERGGDAAPTCVVPLSPTGRRPPLFLVHPAGGSPLCYAGLIPHLGPDQPVYGLQCPGLHDDEQTPDTVEALAARYVRELRQVVPSGPYCLGGWSFGGVVAFEMARLLAQASAPVPLLALLDSGVVSAGGRPLGESRLRVASAVSDVLRLFFEIKPPTSYQDFLLLSRWVGVNLPDSMRTLLERDAATIARYGRSLALNLPRLMAVYKTNFLSAVNYQPRPYGGPVTLFRATGSRLDRRMLDLEQTRDFVTSELEVELVPGNHMTLLSQENVGKLGQALRTRIDRLTGA
ncbi:polyketide synthase [Hyalangium gracile]|uniref:polyketide synthase n=1 Tax=Hyalangium gracile TaxID=394092 RepID=UPI001CCAD13F|nr:polyketide synthase [Hyalangium gracile]